MFFAKKRIFLQCKSVFSYGTNDGGNFEIGIPTLVFQLLTSLSIALINRASGDYGDSVIAGMGGSHANYFYGNACCLWISERVSAYCRIQLWGEAV